MLTELLAGSAQRQIEAGIIAENLLDGYYRVDISGTVYTAKNQSSVPLVVGSVVSVTATSWGRFIVSGAAQHAATIPTIIIRG